MMKNLMTADQEAHVDIDSKYMGFEMTMLAQNIMSEGFGQAVTARGCRGAIRRGLKRTYNEITTSKHGYSIHIFDRKSEFGTGTGVACEDAGYEWAVYVSGALQNPIFFAEPQNNWSLAVYKK